MAEETANGAPIRVQPGPANYWSYNGAISELERLFTWRELDRAVWVAGENAESAAAPYLPPAWRNPGASRFRFTGHCTREFVDWMASQSLHDATVIVGIGGGAALDSAKALSIKLALPFVAIPTIAATCAATTPLSVWYTSEGKALGFEVFRHAAEAVLVEPRIILGAPPKYFRAGLADTLAKWYEADILCEGKIDLPFTAQLGLQTAKWIATTLLEKGESALEAMRWQELTPEFLDVMDAILAGGGLVGGLGERHTRVAAAHAVHNGLSALPETAAHLHGTKVAYGLLVQSALIGSKRKLSALIRKFRALKLPVSLVDLGVNPGDRAKLAAIANAALAPHESIHLLPFPVDADRLIEAIDLVETISEETDECHQQARGPLDSANL